MSAAALLAPTGTGPETALPLWQCHKQVRACKIGALVEEAAGFTIVPAEKGLAPFRVAIAYVQRHSPRVGGYYVEYRDGYASFSPGKEFEDGYTLCSELVQRKARLEADLETINRAIEAHHQGAQR